MNSDFSKKLSLLRQERGVSQRTAATDLAISQALLSHYENGIREPGLPFVVRACDYYHVSADYILGRTLSKDGAMIASDEVYDPEAERTGVLKGSVLATLQNKLLSGAISVLFDLLGRLGDRDAVNAAGAYLGSAVYQLYRHLYRCAGRNEDYFSAEPDLFTLDAVSADMKLSQVRYARALERQRQEKKEFPDLSDEHLHEAYPGRCQSVTQVLHNTDTRLGGLMKE